MRVTSPRMPYSSSLACRVASALIFASVSSTTPDALLSDAALVLAVLSASVIRRRWFTGLMVLSTLLICYSRIYLGKHYPMDLVWGTAVGIALGLAAFWTYRRLSRPKKELQ